jgi:voltage-gated sodium channel
MLKLRSAITHHVAGKLRRAYVRRMLQRGLIAWSKRVSESNPFHAAVVAVILANALVVGLETSRSLVAANPAIFSAAHAVILTLFVAELVIRAGAYGFHLGAFLRDGWNLFDFLVVAVSLVPGVGAFATVARIARVLRVARLVSVSPKLRLIVGTMTRSIPSLAHVSLLLSLLLYLYAVIGVNLFGAHDPAHWGGLRVALLTLFQILTLEGWVEVQGAVIAAAPWAWVYFASFVVVAVFVVVNLFIAVVLNNLDEIREEDRLAALAEEERHRPTDEQGFERHLAALRADIDRLEALYRRQVVNRDAAASRRPAP